MHHRKTYRPNLNVSNPALPACTTFVYTLGKKVFELSNHASTSLSTGLGNVLTTISDRKTAETSGGTLVSFHAQILSSQDYYPFACLAFGEGSTMPGRSFSSEAYRFGFNTQERDDEIYGTGNSYTALYWQYDARIGRRWNIDPVPQVFISDYACFGNSPILYSDVKGNYFVKKSDERKARRIERTANNRIGLLENKLNDKNLSEKERINIRSSIEDLSSVKGEIDEMRSSAHGFTFKRIGYREERGGNLTIDPYGVLTINYSGFSSMVHEAKHAHQFLKGDISFKPDGKHASMSTYDAIDEVQAYQRSFSFGDRGHFENFSDITPKSIKDMIDPRSGVRSYNVLSESPQNYLDVKNAASLLHEREYFSYEVMYYLIPNALLYKRNMTN